MLGRRLVMIVETDGRDLRRVLRGAPRQRAPRVIEWEALMKSLQEPPPGARRANGGPRCARSSGWRMRTIAPAGPLDADHGSAALAEPFSSPPHRHHRCRRDRAIGAPASVRTARHIRWPVCTTSIRAAAQRQPTAFGDDARVPVARRPRATCRRRSSTWRCRRSDSVDPRTAAAWRAGPDSEADGTRPCRRASASARRAHARDLVAAVNFQLRFSPNVLALHDLIDARYARRDRRRRRPASSSTSRGTSGCSSSGPRVSRSCITRFTISTRSAG